MNESSQEGIVSLHDLPRSVRRIGLDGRDVYLVGTAHVSPRSVQDVKETVEKIRPDAVCVELCEARYRIFQNPGEWRNMDIFDVLRKGRTTFLLAQLVMTSFYKRLGEKLGVQPGAEMAEGIRLAEALGARLTLADRDVQVTFRRVWGHLGLWEKAKLLTQLFGGLLFSDEIDKETVEELHQEGKIEDLMSTFAASFPSVKEILIDERDVYLSQKIRETEGRTIVAVVGAGHVSGIEREIQKQTPLEAYCEIPPPGLAPKIIKWLIPALIVGLIVYGFFRGGTSHSVESIYIWFFVNGILSALGAALAFGHPLTVLSAFVAAPFTSLNPMIAAGWVAGLVQAFLKKPRVIDLENLPKDISTFRGFWRNPVCRILLVVALANLGSALGTFVAGGWIAARTV